jgi:spermidine synthase
MAGGLAAASVGIVAFAGPLYDATYEKLMYKKDYSPDHRFVHVYEGKSGVVTVSASDNVYGGGSYDGCFSTDPTPGQDRNRTIRAYLVPAFHPAPREILIVGLGAGAWLQILANDPEVERITAIEINPGYAELMKSSPVVASALTKPKVEIVIDDGLRFLRRVPHRYDVIIQNTIAFWRSHATNLLSREYMELTRAHLKPGGVVYVNSTSSTACQKTVASVFPYAWRFQNMMIAGDSPIEIDRDRWRRRMAEWTIDGRPAMDWEEDGEELEKSVFTDLWRRRPIWEDRGAVLRRTSDDPIITDDNMATEWGGHRVYPEPPW